MNTITNARFPIIVKSKKVNNSLFILLTNLRAVKYKKINGKIIKIKNLFPKPKK